MTVLTATAKKTSDERTTPAVNAIFRTRAEFAFAALRSEMSGGIRPSAGSLGTTGTELNYVQSFILPGHWQGRPTPLPLVRQAHLCRFLPDP